MNWLGKLDHLMKVLRVVVDGNETMVMENMVAFHWTYEQQQERTVTTKMEQEQGDGLLSDRFWWMSIYSS